MPFSMLTGFSDSFLELTDAGFDFSVLSEFRQCLLVGNAEERLLNHLLVCCQEHKWGVAHIRTECSIKDDFY